MSKLGVTDFDLLTAATQVFYTAGATRYDIEVEGSVLVVNTGGDTVGTITDTSENFYWAGSFSLTATGGAAAGKVVAVSSDAR